MICYDLPQIFNVYQTNVFHPKVLKAFCHEMSPSFPPLSLAQSTVEKDGHSTAIELLAVRQYEMARSLCCHTKLTLLRPSCLPYLSARLHLAGSATPGEVLQPNHLKVGQATSQDYTYLSSKLSLLGFLPRSA